MQFVIGPVRSNPADERQRADSTGLRPAEPGNEGVVGHIAKEVHVEQLELLAPGGLNASVKLNQKKTGNGRDLGKLKIIGLGFRRCGDRFVAQTNFMFLGLNSEKGTEEKDEGAESR